MRQKVVIRFYDRAAKETTCDKIDMEGGFFILINEDPASLRFVNAKDVKTLSSEDHPVTQNIVN